jgi:CRP-like cAMP-binding protein
MNANPISKDLWGRYDHLVHSRTYGAGHGLYEQGDAFAGLYRIESGLVGLRKVDENGATILVGLLGTGDFVGYGPLLAEGDHPTSAEVLRPTQIAFVDAKTTRALARDVPAFLPAVFRQAIRDLSHLEERYMQMGTEQAYTRLARLLLTLCEHAGCCSSSGTIAFHLPILNKDMADLIGIRPETLSRAIAHLRSAGVAEFRGRTVHLSNLGKLARMVGSDSIAHALAA